MHFLTQSFLRYIRTEKLFDKHHHLLVAVSGGVDSIVLCDVLRSAGFSFEIAHCNFKLRGEESDRDEAFVKKYSADHGIPVHIKSFDTKDYARENSCSIQEAARKLRYGWFESLMQAGGETGSHFDFLLTAHNANDNAETLLLNFFRGTGLSGLKGILPSRDRIHRPLLFAPRKDIVDYANHRALDWVEDSSNISEKYARNFLRLSVIPQLEQYYPGLISTLNHNAKHMREVLAYYEDAMAQTLAKMLVIKGREQMVPIGKLLKTKGAAAILYAWLRPFGFSSDQAGEALHLASLQTGQYIHSREFRLLKNRNWLVLTPIVPEISTLILLEADQGSLSFAAGQLEWKVEPFRNQVFPTENNRAMLDTRGIKFPLILRPWKPGDYFYPLGMRKKKKLSRFFIDNKLSRIEKQASYVLESGGRIIWVVGLRPDDRFKVTPSTSQVLLLGFNVKSV